MLGAPSMTVMPRSWMVSTVLTGYFATTEQVEASARFIERLRLVTPGLRVTVDPIIGDGHALYIPEPVAIAVRGHRLLTAMPRRRNSAACP